MKAIVNIHRLYGTHDLHNTLLKGIQLNDFPFLENAFMIIDQDLITDFGIMPDYFQKYGEKNFLEIIDAKGGLVLPCWCDSHTHLVYAATREAEFKDRITGLSYEDIAARGGGILNSAIKMASISEQNLLDISMERAKMAMRMGTGSMEIKSGYGLTLESELKMLRVIRLLAQQLNISIKSTFLGAHAVPAHFKNNKEGYIKHLINEMLPAVANEKLADYCDVFCERNYFTQAETITILEAAKKHGMIPKVHANQLSYSGGVAAGVHCNAVSVDHLEYVAEEEIKLLQQSETIPVILPGAQFFLQLPMPPARTMIDAGLALAIASDYNPGSSPSANMAFNVSIACIQYKLNINEALNAATLNGAAAMNLAHEVGSIAVGKKANFQITVPLPSADLIPYHFAHLLTHDVFINGNKI